jgi:hypothetical protein
VVASRSLLDEPRATTNAEITVAVTEADTRAAVWLGHTWTRRVVVSGVSLVVALAGLWGNAVLDSFQALRSDFAAYTQRMDGRWESAGREHSLISERAAVTNQRLNDYEVRLGKLEVKIEGATFQRYLNALHNYEERHPDEQTKAPD